MVKYSEFADRSTFESDAPYTNEPVSVGDLFLVKVTSSDATATLYYEFSMDVGPSILTNLNDSIAVAQALVGSGAIESTTPGDHKI